VPRIHLALPGYRPAGFRPFRDRLRTLSIARRLVETLAPHWLRIGGYWYPRGGIPIDIFYQTGEPPAGVWLPDPDVAPYRGRG